MDIYYTVDRSCTLQPGDVLALDSEFSLCRMFPVEEHFDRADLADLTCTAFPGGLSSHGKKYFLDECLVVRGPDGPAPFAPHIPMIELVAELIRRLEFPDHPSRFQAFFAWNSYDEAIAFRDAYCEGQGNVLRVDGSPVGSYDMNQLFLGGTTAGSWMFARRYWSGVASEHPRWEVLLQSPCAVLEMVQE